MRVGLGWTMWRTSGPTRRCDAICDVTRFSYAAISPMGTVPHECPTVRNIRATASEASDKIEACWQSRSAVLNQAQSAVTIHTQEVWGSSPRAPTITFNNLQPQ